MHCNLRGYFARLLMLNSHIATWSAEGNSITAGGVSLSLSAKRRFVNLDVVSVPSTPQCEVLNPRFSEYPPWWPVFHRAEAAFIGLTRELACRLHAARLPSILSGLSTVGPGNTCLILLSLEKKHNVGPVCKRQWLWKSVQDTKDGRHYSC